MGKRGQDEMTRAIDVLANAMPNGQLMAALGPLAFLGSAAEHIKSLDVDLATSQAAVTRLTAELDEARAIIAAAPPATVKQDLPVAAPPVPVEPAKPKNVFAVVYGSYADDEVHALYETRELATREANRLGGMWTISEWTVNAEPDEAPAAAMPRETSAADPSPETTAKETDR